MRLVSLLSLTLAACTPAPVDPTDQDVAHYIQAARDASRWRPGGEVMLKRAFSHPALRVAAALFQLPDGQWRILDQAGGLWRLDVYDPIARLPVEAIQSATYVRDRLYVSGVGDDGWRVERYAIGRTGASLEATWHHDASPPPSSALTVTPKGQLFVAASHELLFFDRPHHPARFASGFAHPRLLLFDGAPWLFDRPHVGADTELNHVQRGYDYGWPIRHGHRCVSRPDCRRRGLVEPEVAYEETTLTAGIAYGGTQLAALSGGLIYSDDERRLWSYRRPTRPRVIGSAPAPVVLMSVDRAGEPWLVTSAADAYQLSALARGTR